MKVHRLIQGSAAWLAYRALHFNASDAPAMMGCSSYKTRAELLRELHTGVVAEVDPVTQKRFDAGHRLEALARPLAEEFIGAELYPVTGSEGRWSASFDGLVLDETEGFEHKQLNATLKAAFAAIADLGPCDDTAPCWLLPVYHRIQMDQQLLVSGAARILFMASDWSAADELIEEQHCWYYPDAELRAQIIAGWNQFEKDLGAYSLPESEPARPVGKTPQTLPALRIEVTGTVTASNLAEFKQSALAAIRSVNRTLATDQDFADADKAIKWCADVEGRLVAAKEHALSQTASIDALFKTIDDIAAESKRVRLDLDKLVTRRKTEVKEEAVARARRVIDAHIAMLNAEIAPLRLPAVVADFAAAIKGKKSLTSMQDALDSMLAGLKIEADASARSMRANLTTFHEQAGGFEFLFADLSQLVLKASDDFRLQVQARIDAHRAAQAEQARKALQAETQRQAQAEAQRKLQADAAVAADDAARVAAAAALQAVAAPPPPAPPLAAVVPLRAVAPIAAPASSEPATLKLGTVCERLGFTMTAAFIGDSLGIKPAKIDGAAKLYCESDFGRICQALQLHIQNVTEAISA